MATTRKKSSSTAVAAWDEQLAKYAEAASTQESSVVTGQFFGLKNGVLTFNSNPLPNNEMAVIVLDSVLENVFYEGRYDPDTPQSPTCFAFGRDDKTIFPHKIVVEAGQAQHDQCHGCPHNEFGSADTGKGKACRNTRRVGMIPAGTFDKQGNFTPNDDPSHYADAEVAFMKLPVTSVRGYAAYVKQVAGSLRRPPFGVFTRVSVVPDPKSQFKVIFEPLEEVPGELLQAIIARHEEVKETIDFPYALGDDEEPPAKASRGKSTAARGGAKTTAGRGGRKY